MIRKYKQGNIKYYPLLISSLNLSFPAKPIVRHAVTANPTRQFVRQQLLEFSWNFEGKRICKKGSF